MSKMKTQLQNDPLMPLRHTTEHVLQLVVEKLLGIKKVMGPAIETGFYGDFYGKVNEENLKTIEDEMKKVIQAKLPIKTSEITYAEAKKLFKDNKFKLEIIEEINNKKEPIGVCEIGEKGN
jgi:threonyl-tRNA synthetase